MRKSSASEGSYARSSGVLRSSTGDAPFRGVGGTVNAFKSLAEIPDDMDYGLNRLALSPREDPPAPTPPKHQQQKPPLEKQEQVYDTEVNWDALSDDEFELNYEESYMQNKTSPLSSPAQQSQGRAKHDEAKEGLAYSKKPRPIKFEPYTLKQYKMIKPKEYIEFSKLQPDLNSDELRAKRANRERVKEFAKNLHSFNKNVIEHTKLVAISNDCADGDVARPKAVVESSRERALQFAKRIPAPRPKAMSAEGDKGVRQGRRDSANKERDALLTARDEMVTSEESRRQSRLLELESKHSFDRQQVSSIKKSLGM